MIRSTHKARMQTVGLLIMCIYGSAGDHNDLYLIYSLTEGSPASRSLADSV